MASDGAGAGAGTGSSSEPKLTLDIMKAVLPKILSAIPAPWRGTTFKNDNLLLRAGFSESLTSLILAKHAEGADSVITPDELYAVGNAEDYLRVSSNMSSLLEITLGLYENLPVDQVFTFSSQRMPLVAVALATLVPVHVYAAEAPFTDDQLAQLKLIGAQFVLHVGGTEAPTAPTDGGVVVRVRSELILKDGSGDHPGGVVDAVVAPNTLFILNPSNISHAKVLVVRKRTTTPLTTPVAETHLQTLAGVPVTADTSAPSDAAVADFYAHLQTLSGTEVDTDCTPVVMPAGLAALAALWVTLISQGGADILMCSTAYGGSSQLVDVLGSSAPTLKKHKFDIQGTTPILDSIRGSLDALIAVKDSLMPTTVLFVEMPTNPDMKIPDLPAVADLISGYTAATGKPVILLVDATFAPASAVMTKLRALVPDVAVIVFLSMSKSVSRGMTTAGTLIANHTPRAKDLVTAVKVTTTMLDTHAKPDQMTFLVKNHKGVEDRCARAYAVANSIGETLRSAVREAADGYDMPLAFVTPDQAEQGFTTSTFSFNLPPPKDATPEVTAGLAQKFVDLLCAHPKEFKPCVSFGQDNGLVYATVPATSTQGAIAEEDKAKQAVGGVQLTRVSFSPGVDVAVVSAIVQESIRTLYA